MAPASMASCTSACMAEISSGRAGRSRSAITAARKVEWPTMAATLSAGGVSRKAWKYAEKLPKRPWATGSSRLSGAGMGMSSRSGAMLMPQLPATTVVTPCEALKGMSGWVSSAESSWVCESMKPGATTKPVASSVSCAAWPASAPMATMRPLRTPTSAVKRGARVPSMTVPPVISRSKGRCESMGCSIQRHLKWQATRCSLALALARGVSAGACVLHTGCASGQRV